MRVAVTGGEMRSPAVACAGWILFSVLHLVFHARHLHGFGTRDAVAQLASLAAVVALPALALWAARPARAAVGRPG